MPVTKERQRELYHQRKKEKEEKEAKQRAEEEEKKTKRREKWRVQKQRQRHREQQQTDTSTMLPSFLFAKTPAKTSAKTPQATPKTPAEHFEDLKLSFTKMNEESLSTGKELQGLLQDRLDRRAQYDEQRAEFDKDAHQELIELIRLAAVNKEAQVKQNQMLHGTVEKCFLDAAVDSPPAVVAPPVVDSPLAAAAPDVAYVYPDDDDVAVMDEGGQFQPGTGVLIVSGKYQGEIGEVADAIHRTQKKIPVHLERFAGKPKLFFPDQLETDQEH